MPATIEGVISGGPILFSVEHSSKYSVAGAGFEPAMPKAYETPVVTRPYPQLNTLIFNHQSFILENMVDD